MNELKIHIDDQERRFFPGDDVEGSVTWYLEDAPKRVILNLFWHTRGKGDRDVAIVSVVEFPEPLREDRRDFRFTLPNAPYSFSGRLISLIWALELLVEPSGESARVEITVSPTREEILLHQGPRSGE